MAVHGCIWPYMAVYGRIWLYIVVYGCIWLYMAAHSYVRPYATGLRIFSYFLVISCIFVKFGALRRYTSAFARVFRIVEGTRGPLRVYFRFYGLLGLWCCWGRPGELLGLLWGLLELLWELLELLWACCPSALTASHPAHTKSRAFRPLSAKV